PRAARTGEGRACVQRLNPVPSVLVGGEGGWRNRRQPLHAGQGRLCGACWALGDTAHREGRCLMRAGTSLLAGWLVLLGVACNREEARKLPADGTGEREVEALPDDVVKTWKEAGAEPGWVGPDRFGEMVLLARREQLDAVRAVPGFHFDSWRQGILA